MKHVQQPKDSKLCGQCCLAMVLNVPLSQAIALVGHTGGTETDEIIKAVRKGGLRCDDNLKKGKPRGTCIVKMNRRGRRSGGWHWLVYDRGTWHDPAFDGPDRICNGDVTSYLMVF